MNYMYCNFFGFVRSVLCNNRKGLEGWLPSFQRTNRNISFLHVAVVSLGNFRFINLFRKATKVAGRIGQGANSWIHDTLRVKERSSTGVVPGFFGLGACLEPLVRLRPVASPVKEGAAMGGFQQG